MNTNYQEVISAVKNAVKFANDVENKWVKAGSEVFAFYGSEKALDEVKAQFCADAIIPSIDSKHAKALAVDLPRKGSKEFNEMISKDSSYQVKWDIANQAKKDARSTIGVYYSRVVKYAFPAEKKESVKKGFADKLKALIEDGGKLKEADFDLVKVMGFLNQALNAIEKK